ncbi:hypothetical protein BGX38DRAFT_553392 [Terfezia claveryi]|nr:hypothetical protein BGX38DRAFT_553392 [Terfezia claveryi]
MTTMLRTIILPRKAREDSPPTLLCTLSRRASLQRQHRPTINNWVTGDQTIGTVFKGNVRNCVTGDRNVLGGIDYMGITMPFQTSHKWMVVRLTGLRLPLLQLKFYPLPRILRHMTMDPHHRTQPPGRQLHHPRYKLYRRAGDRSRGDPVSLPGSDESKFYNMAETEQCTNQIP